MAGRGGIRELLNRRNRPLWSPARTSETWSRTEYMTEYDAHVAIVDGTWAEKVLARGSRHAPELAERRHNVRVTMLGTPAIIVALYELPPTLSNHDRVGGSGVHQPDVPIVMNDSGLSRYSRSVDALCVKARPRRRGAAEWVQSKCCLFL